MSKVTVTPDELGNVIRVSKNNAEYGHVRLTQSRVTFKANGWVKKSDLSTLIHGKVEDLEDIGIAQQETLPGKIIIRERLEPFSTEDPDRDMKRAGEDGVICVYNDQPIYRKTFFVQDENVADELIAHTNSEEIKEAQSLDGIAGNTASDKKVTISKKQLEEITKSTNEEEIIEEEETVEVEEKEDTFEL